MVPLTRRVGERGSGRRSGQKVYASSVLEPAFDTRKQGCLSAHNPRGKGIVKSGPPGQSSTRKVVGT